MKRSDVVTQIKIVLGRELPGKYVSQELADLVLNEVEQLGMIPASSQQRDTSESYSRWETEE
jgi:hypothetical protein